MTNETYSKLALRTCPPAHSVPLDQSALTLAALGLAGEIGEVVDCIKKHVFHGHPLDRDMLIKELGDVEWYANLLRVYLNTTLEEVHAQNILKLSMRYPRGFFTTEQSVNRAAGDE